MTVAAGYQAPALLKAGYRVIVPDTLGYGGTDRPVEVEHYKLEGIIDHMFEIIDTLGLKDINLMGHDWGSAITWPMILRRPELFRKYISMSVGHIGAFYGQAFSPRSGCTNAACATGTCTCTPWTGWRSCK